MGVVSTFVNAWNISGDANYRVYGNEASALSADAQNESFNMKSKTFDSKYCRNFHLPIVQNDWKAFGKHKEAMMICLRRGIIKDVT